MTGVLEYIAIRPDRASDIQILDQAILIEGHGIHGDHYQKSGNREVTLIQAEDLEVIGRQMNKNLTPGITRRNLVIKGFDLLSVRTSRFRIGEVILEGTGDCRPCELMNKKLGNGGMDIMLGKGGITAKIIKGGIIRSGESIMNL
jgi:MOSC domain-containing protein YiiM